MRDIERLVEAHLLGIELSEAPRIVKLAFREPNGRRLSLSGFDLHRLRVSELRETNIVDRLNLWDSSADPALYRDALRELVSGEDCSQDEKWDPVIEVETQAVRDGIRVFANIEAVYGAQVLMLAKSIVIE